MRWAWYILFERNMPLGVVSMARVATRIDPTDDESQALIRAEADGYREGWPVIVMGSRRQKAIRRASAQVGKGWKLALVRRIDSRSARIFADSAQVRAPWRRQSRAVPAT